MWVEAAHGEGELTMDAEQVRAAERLIKAAETAALILPSGLAEFRELSTAAFQMGKALAAQPVAADIDENVAVPPETTIHEGPP